MLPSPQILNQVASFIQEKGKSAYYCLFLLGKEAGLRVSEAVNFNLSLKKKSNLYLIHGKKHKKRAVFIDPQIISELKQNHWKPINIFISEPNKNLELENENKLLQEKVKQLEWEKKEQEQIIINLKNDKENLTKQLIQVQNEKEVLLKMLTVDLKKQKDQLSKQVAKPVIQELEQQLIAQIQVITKN